MTDLLQAVKQFIRDTLGMPPALTLIVIGCVAHLTLNALLRKPPFSPWGLFAPLVLGLLIEAWEIREQYGAAGLLVPGNDPLPMILLRHGLDVGLLLAGPLLLVLLEKWRS